MTYHRNVDEAHRKHFTMLLENKCRALIKAHPNSLNSFRVWVDPIASSYKKADEVVGIILKRQLGEVVEGGGFVHGVYTRGSKEVPAIQLCDLLLGAVMDGWQQDAFSVNKLRIRQHLANSLGWITLLKADTDREDRKFNIWKFYDPKRGEREANTQKVKLKNPLPVRFMPINSRR